MRRVILNPAFDQIRGKIATGQTLEYATKDNAAYEAPNGLQYARNYKPTVILQQRQASGRAYFSIRSKSATRLNANTRRGMGIIGVAQSIYAAMLPVQRNMLQAYFSEYPTPPAKTPKAWFVAAIKDMIVYQQPAVTLQRYGGQQSLLFWNNPYNLQGANAATFNNEVWSKFAEFFSYNMEVGAQTGGVYFTVDGKRFFCPYATSSVLDWTTFVEDDVNPNFVASKSDFTHTGKSIYYRGVKLYHGESAVDAEDIIIGGASYQTVRL